MKRLCLYERDQIFDASFSGVALAVACSMVAPAMDPSATDPGDWSTTRYAMITVSRFSPLPLKVWLLHHHSPEGSLSLVDARVAHAPIVAATMPPAWNEDTSVKRGIL
jgi:hypothetical protein